MSFPETESPGNEDAMESDAGLIISNGAGWVGVRVGSGVSSGSGVSDGLNVVKGTSGVISEALIFWLCEGAISPAKRHPAVRKNPILRKPIVFIVHLPERVLSYDSRFIDNEMTIL
jgi:hypothetical protein